MTGSRFVTETGIEVPTVSAEQMRELDRIAVEETGPNLFQMMENAGRNLAKMSLEILGEKWPEAAIVVLAGTRGNGGGGIVAARHLANRGARVVLCLAAPDRLSKVTAYQRSVYQSAAGEEVEFKLLRNRKPDLIVDALIGYSLRSAPRGPFADLTGWANDAVAPILSLDIPSGVNATTGETPGNFVRALWTMTLALPKLGLAQGRGGTLVLADLGIPQEAFRRMGLPYTYPFGSCFRVPLTEVAPSREGVSRIG